MSLKNVHLYSIIILRKTKQKTNCIKLNVGLKLSIFLKMLLKYFKYLELFLLTLKIIHPTFTFEIKYRNICLNKTKIELKTDLL